MPLLDREASLILRDLLQTDWKTSNVDEEFNPVWISTGRYDNDTDYPEVTLSSFDEDTSPTGIDPGGKGLTSWIDGTGNIGVWVPYTDDYRSAGPAKSFRYQLAREVHRIMQNNAEGTTTDAGEPELTRIETGTVQQFVEENEDEPPIFRAIVPVGYGYHSRPE